MLSLCLYFNPTAMGNSDLISVTCLYMYINFRVAQVKTKVLYKHVLPVSSLGTLNRLIMLITSKLLIRRENFKH